MKLGVLFSGGKDSTYAAYLEKQKGNEIVCLITLQSENKESYMFHTPNIKYSKMQAKAFKIPIIYKKTKGRHAAITSTHAAITSTHASRYASSL